MQLVLYNDPEIGTAVAQLYNGGRFLATVSGAPADASKDDKVEYARTLP